MNGDAAIEYATRRILDERLRSREKIAALEARIAELERDLRLKDYKLEEYGKQAALFTEARARFREVQQAVAGMIVANIFKRKAAARALLDRLHLEEYWRSLR